jgi:hypothetical protein
VIYAVSRTLKTYLETRFPEAASWVTIAARQKTEAETFANAQLSLLLYAVTENAYLRNQGPRPTADGYAPAPLAVTLYYLVAYGSTDAEQVQRRLELVLQAFESTTRIGPAALDPELIGKVDHLSVRLRVLTPEELNRIWTALGYGMRLALYYEVDAALLEPLEPDLTGPVTERRVKAEIA